MTQKNNWEEDDLMTEVERISDQFQRSFDGKAWHGPTVLALLEGVSAAQAATRPVASAHSIWELVQHIDAWERACIRRLKGDPAYLTDEEDWPAVTDTSETAWTRTKGHLVDTHRELLEAIGNLKDADLDRPIIDDPTAPYASIYVTLHGGVQHDLYHAGQIAILKKALS
jgi:uncharacterized damage-inducible protein DinB